MAKKSIEQRAAETILQDPMEVKVGSKTYFVAPPCAATLILVSKLIKNLPPIERNGNMLNESLAIAKDCKVMYDIVATLIIGAKAIRDEKKVFPFRKGSVDKLAEDLMYECTNEEVYNIVARILGEQMQVSDFFSLSVSLHEISLIQQTRETER